MKKFEKILFKALNPSKIFCFLCIGFFAALWLEHGAYFAAPVLLGFVALGLIKLVNYVRAQQ